MEEGLLLFLLTPKSEFFLPLAFLELCCSMERVVGIFYAETLLRYPGVVTVVLFSLFLVRAEASERGRDGRRKLIREGHVKRASCESDCR